MSGQSPWAAGELVATPPASGLPVSVQLLHLRLQGTCTGAQGSGGPQGGVTEGGEDPPPFQPLLLGAAQTPAAASALGPAKRHDTRLPACGRDTRGWTRAVLSTRQAFVYLFSQHMEVFQKELLF